LPTQYAVFLQTLLTFSALCQQLLPECNPINMPELPAIEELNALQRR
jgi:hypothetical protein